MNMRIARTLVAVAVVIGAGVALQPSAFAGGCGCGGGGAASRGEEFAATNKCPLAQAANTRRSLGREATTTSTTTRASIAALVQRNLSKI